MSPVDPAEVVVAGNAGHPARWPDPVARQVRLLETAWRGRVFLTLDGGTTGGDTTPLCLE